MVDVGPPPQAETGHGLEAVLRRNKEQRVPVLVHLGRFRRLWHEEITPWAA